MNKNIVLLTAASVATFFAATQALAGGPDASASAAASKSHVNLSLEGWYGRSNDMVSIFQVDNKSNASPAVYTANDPADLTAKSQWGWAAELGYTFDDGSDLTVSYRNIDEKTKTNTYTYQSISQIYSVSGQTYTDGTGSAAADITTTDAVSNGSIITAIGNGADNNAYAILSATDTLTEVAEIKYQQANFDWGHAIKVSNGFSFRPYVGVGWRSIGYKDTMTFASLGATSGAAPTATVVAGDVTASTDFIIYQGASGAANADLLINGSAVLEISSGDDISISGTTVIDTDPNDSPATDNYFVNQNVDSDVSDQTGYIGDRLPSYNSKFSGFGPRFGFDSTYAFGNYFAVTAGMVFTMPYAQLKTSGNTTVFTTEDLQTGGNLLTDTTTTATLKTNANLKAATLQSFSHVEHKFIPEMELKLGLRVANDITQEGDMTYFLEAGYRVIQDWNAIENVNASATSTVEGVASSHFGSSPSMNYADVTNFGPYLKAGITFGT